MNEQTHALIAGVADQPEAVVETALNSLADEYEKLKDQETLGTRQLWGMLGRVYESGCKIDQNEDARKLLLDRVSKIKSVAISRRWKPNGKSAHELLLVSILGVSRETKAKKSQWLASIKAAQAAEVKASSGEFIKYLETVGGVDQARASAATKATRLTADELYQFAFGLELPDQATFNLPKQFVDSQVAAGELAVVLVKVAEAGEGVPLAMISHPTTVGTVIRRLKIQSDKASESLVHSSGDVDSSPAEEALGTGQLDQEEDYDRSMPQSIDG